MIRSSIAFGLLAIGLSACDSEGIDRVMPAPNDPATSSSSTISASDTNSATSTAPTTDAENTVNSQSGAGSIDIESGSGTFQPIVVPSPSDDDASQSSEGGQNSSNSTTSDSSDNDINMLGGSGSSDGGQNSADPTTSDASDNDINMLGGSGSSDGGQNSSDSTTSNSASDDINMLGGSGSSDGGENTTDQSDTTANSDAAEPQSDEDTSLSLEPPASGTTFISTTSPVHYGGPECSFPNKDDNGDLIFNGKCPTVKRAGNVAFGDFLLANNTWNDCASAFANWTQCISVDDSSGKAKARWDYDWGNESDVRGAVWLVKSYPEVIYGVKSPGEYSAPTLAQTVVATGLPAKVSSLPFYKISYTASSDEYPSRSKVFNGQTINGERNIAVESFFHELGGDCDVNTLIRNGTTSNQRFELMVWVDAGAERLPAAPNDYVTTTSIDGQQYDVYTKPSDREYIAFVAKNSRSSADLNWNSFIEWSREYSHRVNEVFGRGSNTVKIQDGWCLANILLGTEIWWGNGFFQLDDYSIQRTER